MPKVPENSDNPTSLSIAGGERKARSQKELEAELARLNSLFNDTQHQTKTAYWEYIPSTQKITWSDYVYRLLGYDPQSIIPSNEAFDKVLHPDDIEHFIEMRNKLAKENMPNGFEFRIIVSGKIKYLKMTGVSEKDEEGNVTRLIGTTQDITELKQNEERLRKINRFAKDLIDLNTQQDLIWYVVKQVVSELDLEDCVIYLFDKQSEKLIQSAAYGQKSGGEREINNALSIELGSGITGHVAKSKTPLIIGDVSKDDRYISDIPNMGSEISVPILHEGQLFGVIDCEHSEKHFFTESHLGLLSTIATLLAAKLGQWDNLDKIQTSEEQYREAQRIAHFGSWDWDLKTHVIKWSEETCHILGIDPNDVVPDYEKFENAIHTDDWAYMVTAIEQTTSGQQDFDIEFRVVRPSGEVRYVHAQGEALFDKDNMPSKMSGSMLDITRRKRAEIAAKEYEDRLQEVFRLAPEAIITVDNDLKIQLFNWNAERTFGYEQKEVLGKHVNMLLPKKSWLNHNKYIAEFRKSEKVSLTMNDPREVVGIKKNGEIFPADAAVAKVATEGGNVFIVMLRDVTTRKQTEDALNSALKEAQIANQTKSNFLATMSHELRTPLNAIIGFSEMMTHQIFGDIGSEKYLDYAHDIHYSSQHLLNLVNSILDLSALAANKYHIDKTLIEVQDVIDNCSTIINKLSADKNITCTYDVTENIRPVYSDIRSLTQILLNLLSNSIKYTPLGGKIVIKVTSGRKGHIFEVSDTGSGIPSDKLAIITEPFTRISNDPFKTNEGTGLGLSIVKSLVELHGGKLEILSPDQKGTIVRITLPFAPS